MSCTSVLPQVRPNKMHELEVVQGLSRNLAQHIARDIQLMDANGLKPDAVRELFSQLMLVNPSVEAYLVDGVAVTQRPLCRGDDERQRTGNRCPIARRPVPASVQYRWARRDGGLGLRIVHQILQLHGHRIKLVDVPGQGATFRFALPVDQQTAQAVLPKQ
ncbi:hypothetical protein EC915_101921 [Pseudomonas sp. LP_7_YM]|nr:hypothetical protein EC915_101921 [Pseudomonas sp. LP_7_YM]